MAGPITFPLSSLDETRPCGGELDKRPAAFLEHPDA
jgi:hypothetical protein